MKKIGMYSLLSLLALGLAVLGGAPAAASEAKADDPANTTRAISLQLRGADVRDALMLVGKQGNVDMVMSKSVTGKVTVDLEKASLVEALDAIVKTSGLEYRISGRIVTVMTLTELMAYQSTMEKIGTGTTGTDVRVFLLRYVDAERIMPIVEGILSPNGKAMMLLTSDHVGTGGADTRGSSPASDGGSVAIGSALSTSTEGRPARSHTIVVRDLPAVLENVEMVLAKIDVKPAQILIEARIVEITLTDTDRLGIDWNVIVRGAGASAPHTFPFGDSKLGSFDPRVSGGGASGGIFPNATNLVTTPEDAGIFTFGTLDFTAFTSVLRMIQRNSNVELVSNPRVVVRDRNTSTILVGERFPILSNTVTDQGTSTVTLDHYEPIGVQLQVTPSVLGNGEIGLIVRPSTSSVGPTVLGSGGEEFVRINTRQLDTTVTVKDGQTVVLGGLVSTRKSETVSKVPLLGSIPLLGELFTHRSTDVEKVDLVIFVTVTLLKDGGLTDADRRMFEKYDPNRKDVSGSNPNRSSLELTASKGEY